MGRSFRTSVRLGGTARSGDKFATRFEAHCAMRVSAGHDVQLHLHAEWLLRATHDGRDWRFQPHTDRSTIWDSILEIRTGLQRCYGAAKSTSESLLCPFRETYRCIAFRAGGWVLQPRNPSWRRCSKRPARRCDIIPGARLLRTDYTIDFRSAPDRTHWFIDPERGLGIDSGRPEDLLEISIAAYRGALRPLHHALSESRLRRRARIRPEPRRGSPLVKLGPRPGPWGRVVQKYRKLTIPRMLDLADTHEAMLATLRWYLRHFDCKALDLAVCMNGHPKDTYDYHLAETRRFLDIVRTRYRDVVRFETIAACQAGCYRVELPLLVRHRHPSVPC